MIGFLLVLWALLFFVGIECTNQELRKLDELKEDDEEN